MTPPAPPPGPSGPTHLFPLPVWETVREALSSWGGLLGQVPRLAAVPYALIAAITIVQSLILPANEILSLALNLATLVPYTMFAVAWHRLVLLGPTGTAGWSLRFEPRHWRFAGLLVALYLLMYLGAGAALSVIGVVAGISQQAPGGGMAGLFVVVIAVAVAVLAVVAYLRLTFVFPAVAVDERFGFLDAWRVTAGCGLRLLAIFVAVGFVSLLPVMLIQTALIDAFLPQAMTTETDPAELMRALLVPNLILQAVYLPVVAASITALSVSFRTRTGWIP